VVVGEKPTLYGSANHARSLSPKIRPITRESNSLQRESSATIKAPPIAYQQTSPPTRQKILEFDCRGLEFTEFQPEVSFFSKYY